MPELDFQVVRVAPARHAATPTLEFILNINQGGEPARIQCVQLQCQLRIDCVRRGYRPSEQERLRDLFGAPERWKESLHSLLWTHAAVVVPAFESRGTTATLPVPCSFDFNIAATKYFHGLEEGGIPLALLFSGSVFYRDASGHLAVAPIPWDREAAVELPAATWREMMDRYYPDSAWLQVKRESLEALYRYKRTRGLTDFDKALSSLLAEQRPGEIQS